MNKKKIIMAAGFIMLAALLVNICFGQNLSQKQIQFVDEFGEPVNMGTSVSLYIYAAGTTTQQTCYKNRERTLAVTQPVTDDSTNTPLDYTTGTLTFWSGAATYKIVVTDGTYTRTIDNLTGSDGRIAWPSYLTAMSGYALSDSDDLSFGTDTDWALDSDTAGRLDMIPAADGGVLGIGDGTYQSDVYMYAASDQYWLFDEGNAEAKLVNVDIQLDDNADLVMGSDDDFSIDCDTAKTIDFTPSAGTDDYVVNLGLDTYGVDFKMFAATTGDYALWDASDERLEFVGTITNFDDDSDLQFGTDADFVIDSDTTKVLDILAGAATDDYAVNFGLDQSGVDIKAFGATTGEYFLWDASADTLFTNSGNVSFTGTDAEADQFKVSATGTVAGNAIELLTTNGGMNFAASGAANGDITIAPADDLNVTVGGDIVTTVTGGNVHVGASPFVLDGSTNDGNEVTVAVQDPTADYTVTIPAATGILNPSYAAALSTGANTISAAQCYGTVFSNTGVGDAVATLPVAVVGMRVTFVVTDANDIDINPQDGTTIVSNGLTTSAGDAISSDKALGSTVTLAAITTTKWAVISKIGTWSDVN